MYEGLTAAVGRDRQLIITQRVFTVKTKAQQHIKEQTVPSTNKSISFYYFAEQHEHLGPTQICS